MALFTSTYQDTAEDVIAATAEMLTEIARSLVDDPQRVTVDAVADNDVTSFILRVAPDDLGKVVGRQGRTARSIRTVVNAIAVKTQQRFNLTIEALQMRYKER